MSTVSIRNLVIVFGDQLNADASAFEGFDPAQDAVWMAEVPRESTHVWTHKARIALFLSGMRHFADDLRQSGYRVRYARLGSSGADSIEQALRLDLDKLEPKQIVATIPGCWRLLNRLAALAEDTGIPLDLREDTHFLCSREAFTQHLHQRRQPRMEYFYRWMRRQHNILMEHDKPVGGTWNYDAENRAGFGKTGPQDVPTPPRFEPDAITREVLNDVEKHFPDHPGSLEQFAWPVTRKDALIALDAFISNRLPLFGTYQDAMWQREPFLYHSLLSSSLNLKLLHPLEVIQAAENAYRLDPEQYPLNAVEGFIRQILGWREYVRGIYWHSMPEYLELNELGAKEPLPGFYWTGQTKMACMAECVGQVLQTGYAHHIQRLMVTGLFGLLFGVRPKAMHEWYLAMYVDAVEWVELPNTLGMSQYADGGLMASKPYAASGKYIQRMSNYCQGCPYNPAERTGENACPFTTLYWDFLNTHRDKLKHNSRMKFQVNNLARIETDELEAISARARMIRRNPGAL